MKAHCQERNLQLLVKPLFYYYDNYFVVFFIANTNITMLTEEKLQSTNSKPTEATASQSKYNFIVIRVL